MYLKTNTDVMTIVQQLSTIICFPYNGKDMGVTFGKAHFVNKRKVVKLLHCFVFLIFPLLKTTELKYIRSMGTLFFTDSTYDKTNH